MFEIAAARPEDQQAIRRLWTLSPYPETAAQGEVAFFVARSETMLVGAACVELLPDNCALVKLLVVIPGYRKRAIGRQLLFRLAAFAADKGAHWLYAPGLFAEEYFRLFGFTPREEADLPPALREHNFPGMEKFTGRLMARSLLMEETVASDAVAAAAQRQFDSGLLCAESVLAAVAEHLEIESPLIPAIATGFCNGVAGTWGTCGSISGGVLAINLVFGRQEAAGSNLGKNYKAVRRLIQEFQALHGSTQCSELIACDLESAEGRRIYRNNQLRQQCRHYIGSAAALSAKIIEEAQEK